MSSQKLTSKYLGIFRAANVKRFFGLHNAFFVFFFNPVDSSKQYINLTLNLSKKNKPFVVFGLQM